MKDAYNYCGSPSSKELMDYLISIKDDITFRKQILKEYTGITEKELLEEEKSFILEYNANSPEIGYNRRPHFHDIIEA
jgi:hypothetical protein